LKRFVKENYEGEFVQERFVFVCDECKIVISPSLVLLTECESEKERQLLRELYFAQVNQKKEENVKPKNESC
jgi:hypothetical protein